MWPGIDEEKRNKSEFHWSIKFDRSSPKRSKKKEKIKKEFKKITFSQKKGDLKDDEEERSDDISGLMESIGPEVQKKLDNLDLRLKSVENKLNELKESIKGCV